ncbi:sensor domain-containing diguanylate cyclase [Winogradskya consettensis]|uniref:sensor domain-containing diguanylate cyclase n=1 Tax=Winogradskya consettensis TaxID=113560 RepID=UPI001BB44D2A|nr:sensor domain-containing diguanylate cyclase [Actinoplanes consettensis]
MRWSRRGTAVLLAAVVLLAGGVVSAVVGYALARSEQRYASQSMDRYTSDVSAAVTAEVNRYGATLADMSRAVAAQSDLSRDDFRDITDGLDADRLPGASGLSFVVEVAREDLTAVQNYWRAHGAIGLTLRAAGPGTSHEFVIYSRSVDGVPVNPGQDVDTVPVLAEALATARYGGALAATSTYVLLKDRAQAATRHEASFSLVSRVQTRTGRFRGWLVMGVHGADFLDRTISDHSQGVVRVAVNDPSGTDTMVIASTGAGAEDPDPALVRERAISVGQRVWRLTLYPTEHLLSGTDHTLRTVAIGSCLGISLVLAVLVGVLAGARNRAITQVEHATAELRRDIAHREEVEQRLRERESQLEHLAFHDHLTGLVNRSLFHERVTQALITHAAADESFAVIFIDLDGFKQVNDRLGHAGGDDLLRQVGGRLSACLRAGDTIARFGGDEFAVLTEHLADPADVRVAATRIVETVGRPYLLDAGPAGVTASVGIALNRPGNDADDILREADLAMYTAKKAGKARFVVAG